MLVGSGACINTNKLTCIIHAPPPPPPPPPQKNFPPSAGVETATLKWGGGGGGANSTIARCRRQCIVVCSGNESAQSVEKSSPSFFSNQDGLSWHLHALHCKLETPAPKKRGDIVIS